jgi:hypothetical protein
MAESVFAFVAEKLDQGSGLDILEARGTVRFALKSAGIVAAREVNAEEMTVVLLKVMPAELRALGVENADSLCEEIVRSLKDFHSESGNAESSSPEDVLLRLSGK